MALSGSGCQLLVEPEPGHWQQPPADGLQVAKLVLVVVVAAAAVCVVFVGFAVAAEALPELAEAGVAAGSVAEAPAVGDVPVVSAELAA